MLFRYGKLTVDNLVHLVLDSPHDLQPTLWYICEFHSWKNSENWPITRLKSPSSSPSSSSSSQERDDAAKKDLARRERNLEQKEKNLAQKETLLQQKLLRAELREREALEFEQEAKIKLEEVDEKEQELEAEKLALKKNKNKNKYKGTTTSSIPTHHDAENSDENDENPTNENNNNDNQWLLRFSNLQQRLETAYREIEGLRRPVSSAATITTTTTTTATANGDNNDDNDNNNENDNENFSSIITSLQHELKVTKENAQKQKEENIFLWEKLKEAKNQGRRDVNSLVDVDNDVDEASSVGNRWAPLNFRVERRERRRGDSSAMMSTATGRREGEEEGVGIGMIEMQKEFKFLGRLR